MPGSEIRVSGMTILEAELEAGRRHGRRECVAAFLTERLASFASGLASYAGDLEYCLERTKDDSLCD